MKIDIKHKINCIRKGEIPEGYFKIGNNIIPDDWEMKKVKDVVISIVGGGTPSRSKSEYYGGNIPWATVKDLSEDNYKESTIEYITLEGLENSSSKLIEKENFIISTRMGLGRGFINKVPMAINQDLKGIYVNKELVDIRFFMYWFKSLKDYIDNLGNGSTVKGINLQTLRSLDFRLTSIEEQQNISEILSTWDKAIELKEKLIEEKKKQKKGLMQKLLTGKVRLPEFDGEWKEVKLGNVIREISDKTTENNQYQVLTSSRQGIFLQEEYFKKSVASSNNIGYKIIKKGQFTYRTMSDDGSFKFNRLTEYEDGIVSPAYVVFEAIKINPVFLINLMDDYSFNQHIQKETQGGTRLSLKYNALKEFVIRIPSVDEQDSIANVLNTADKAIQLYQKELEALRLQKKGLMQLLLTGIVRVNTQEK